MEGNTNNLERSLDGIARAIQNRSLQSWKRVARVIPTATRSVTSTTLVTVPTDNVVLATLVKKSDATSLIVTAEASAFMPVNGAGAYGVNFGGASYDVGQFFYNTANVYQKNGGVREFIGIAAGTYTFTLMVRVAAGLSWGIDQNGQMNLTIEEVAPL